MGRRCCIAGCQSTSRLPEHNGVTYHSFPLDASIRSVWIKNTRLSHERQITKSVLVCSRHFRRSDFQPIRNGKYLLKARVFPTVFPWGKLDQAQVEADQEALRNSSVNISASAAAANTSAEDVTKATVAATVAQILAETAELNAAAAGTSSSRSTASSKNSASGIASTTVTPGPATPTVSEKASSSVVPKTPDSPAISSESPLNNSNKYEPVSYFGVGARFQAQREDGLWYLARVIESEEKTNEVLVRFEKNSKNKLTYDLKPEWVNKNKCRQRINPRGIPVFELEERCLARWSGPHKFPGTIKKLLEHDTYEVLFDDGYSKNVRALHIKKLTDDGVQTADQKKVAVTGGSGDLSLNSPLASVVEPSPTKKIKLSTQTSLAGSSSKKSKSAPQRKDWPLLDMSKLDLASLNLPAIPHDGEWTCHWVNDQPIGTEGFLIVGEHRKPTVVVHDWRLPTGWVKHMYQRSNVLGKWDVILVSPAGKRFRSKSDLKVYLEDQKLVYNPDVYDFSIHRRRAKDINAYVFTPDYQPQQPVKNKNNASATLDQTLNESSTIKIPIAVTSTPLPAATYTEAPVASLVPPMELMSPQATDKSPAHEATVEGSLVGASPSSSNVKVEDGFAYFGGIKVQIVDNLFCCPYEGCSKSFRKEDHVLMHVKHYHKDMAKSLSECPKMQELAVKRTHPTSIEQQHESQPKNQIPNQQFFAKLHQQDLQQSRSFKRASHAGSSSSLNSLNVSGVGAGVAQPLTPNVSKVENESILDSSFGSDTSKNISLLDPAVPVSASPVAAAAAATSSPVAEAVAAEAVAAAVSPVPKHSGSKRSRYTPSKRATGSRKSNRQRTTRRYVTTSQATSAAPSVLPLPPLPADTSAPASEFEDSSRQSYNATPDSRPSEPKKRRVAASATPVHSPANSTPTSNEPEQEAAVNAPSAATGQYIKENGELIRIVRMRQEEIINCICGYGEEDGLMVQCELCLCWQHGTCNGIMRELDVPEKYVCYICRNPTRARESFRYKHDQEWLYEGRLPTASYHNSNPDNEKIFDFLRKSHILTGNLIEIKQYMHSLRCKMNIASNRLHPKLYLWAKRWEEDGEDASKIMNSPSKRYNKQGEDADDLPNVPQPEAAIDPEECQVRLLNHIKVQQELVFENLANIEAEISALESIDELPDYKDANEVQMKEALAIYIKEVETLKQIAKVNTIANTKEAIIKEANIAPATI